MNIEKLNEEELKDIKRAFTIIMTKLMRRSYINYIKKEKVKNSRIVPVNEGVVKKMSLWNYDNGIFFIENNIKGNELEKIMTKNEHRKAVSKLTKREKQILKALYIDEMDVEDIAKKYNITLKTISNARKLAIDKLRDDMEE